MNSDLRRRDKVEVLSQCAYIGDASQGPNPINSFLRYLPFLILAGFLGEIASIIVVGRWLGVLPTLALIVLGIFLGLRNIRWAGLSLAEAFRQRSVDRRSVNALDRALLAGAGLLFVLPGFLSDLVALLLLVPGTRRWLGRRIAGKVFDAAAPRPSSSQGLVIEGEAVEIEAEYRQLQAPDQPARRD